MQKWFVRLIVILIGVIVGYIFHITFLQNMVVNIYVVFAAYFIILLLMYILCKILYKIHIKIVEKVKNENEVFYKIQVELIKSQLDPHFLFNALNSINFSVQKNDKKTASLNLGFFSKFLRGSIGSLDVFSRSLEEEIQYVKNYLLLEKFRFKEKFDYDFVISPDTNMLVIVPKLILFSFVEEALKKGILPKNKNGRIIITIDYDEDRYVYISICDDGLRREQIDINDKHVKNKILVNKIISYFNKLNEDKIVINSSDCITEDEVGENRIDIRIPFSYKYNF